ncbi:hypothetical protein BDR05DRAFT_147143 [Suillus weaverae]|nr:hypothetical protein BDR05DRAFT_147143 [Suillus weaverae]
MARPTFLQKVLRRPSQKYSAGAASTRAPQAQEQPHTRDFHSTKDELLRIASELKREDPLDYYHESRRYLPDETCEFIQNDEVVLTAATALGSGGLTPSISIPTDVHSEKAQAPQQEAVCELHASADQSIDPSKQNSEEVFYTPASSPTSSSSPVGLSPPASHSQTPAHSPYSTPPHSATSSAASLGSDNPQDISVSTTSLTEFSLSTTVTMMPVKNEPGRHKRIPNNRKLTYTDRDWAKDVRWLEASQHDGTRGKSTRRNTSPSSVSDAASRSASSLPSTVSSHMSRMSMTHVPSQPHDLPKVEPPSPHGRKPKGHGHMKPKAMRAMVGMSVLLEVEEDIDLSGNPAGMDRSMSRRRSQSLTYTPTHTLQPPKSVRQEPSATPSQPVSRLTRRRSSSSPSFSRDGTPSRSSSTRSRSGVTSQTGVSGTSALPVSVVSRPMSSSSHATSSTTKSPYTSAPLNALDALAAHASSSRETDALPSSGTRGFTRLVLPRAATSPATSGSNSGVGSWRPWKAGRRATAAESLGAGLGFGDEIDLTRAGLAQTTMASVEIVRGIASGDVERQESKSRGPLFGLGWFSKGNAKQGKGKSRQVPAESPLDFTAYRKPPVYVGGSSVLVQVWAVGLDDVDARLVGVHPPPSKQPLPGIAHRAEERSAGKRPVPLGYIPGRSFVGRILEVGWDVDEQTLKKGEWVVGLNSVQKCGALAEFILVDRHRIHCVPHPYMPDQPSLVLASLSEASEDDEVGQRNLLAFPSVNEPKGLTVDELALLPLSGVPAYRAVRTLAHITHALVKPDVAARRPRGNGRSREITSDTDEDDFDIVRSIKHGSAKKRLDTTRPRILILRGHDGPGALALQMLVHAGWSVWVHVPVPFDLPGLPHESEEDLQDEGKKHTLAKRRVMLEQIEKRLREWGADEVLFVPIESSSPAPRDDPSSSSPSLHNPQSSSSSTHSQNMSPSPFSPSSTSSTLSSPYSPSTHDHISSTSHPHCALPAPYSYTGLPLTPYQTEKTSATALFTYLTRTRVRFDAVIDTIGGREIWEAGRALLSLPVHDAARASIEGQFTTLVGDAPDRVVSTASDHFRAGVRALRIGNPKGASKVHDDAEFSPAAVRLARGKKDRKMKPRPVNYAWVNVMSDVDWEGADVRDSLGAALAMAVEEGVRPAVGLADFPDMSEKGKGKTKAVFSGGDGETPGKIVSFENTSQVFVPGGGLEHGGTVVSRIAG